MALPFSVTRSQLNDFLNDPRLVKQFENLFVQGTESTEHIDDLTIHFTQAEIDHTVIQNIGTNSHASIDIHIGDATIHFTMLDEDDMASDSNTQAATQQSIKAYIDKRPVRTETTDYLIVGTDYSVIADGTSNTVTVTLPASPSTGQVFNISCLDSTFTVDIDFNGKNFYDSATNELLFKGENLTVQYDGTRWVSV